MSMSKQDIIRGGIEHVITVNHPYIASRITAEVVKYLHSQVLKLELSVHIHRIVIC